MCFYQWDFHSNASSFCGGRLAVHAWQKKAFLSLHSPLIYICSCLCYAYLYSHGLSLSGEMIKVNYTFVICDKFEKYNAQTTCCPPYLWVRKSYTHSVKHLPGCVISLLILTFSSSISLFQISSFNLHVVSSSNSSPSSSSSLITCLKACFLSL